MKFLLPFFAMGVSFASLDVKVDPPNPPLGKIFRVSALAKGVSCEAIQKISTNFPPSWLKISEAKVKKDSGCLVVEVVSSSKEESVAWKGFELTLQGGTVLTGGAGLMFIGNLPVTETPHAGELEAYLKELQNFLSAYVLGGETKDDHFSIESCREPVANIVKVFLRLSPKLVRDYKFKHGCDVEGKGEIRLDTVVPFDLKLRNLGAVDRIKGVSLTKSKKGDGFQMRIDSALDEGELFSLEKIKMKFSLSHTRNVALNLQTFALSDLENEGLLTVTEFEGKAIDFKKPFTGQKFLKQYKGR